MAGRTNFRINFQTALQLGAAIFTQWPVMSEFFFQGVSVKFVLSRCYRRFLDGTNNRVTKTKQQHPAEKYAYKKS